jgi:hypothetical protein
VEDVAMTSTLDDFLSKFVAADLEAAGFRRKGHLFWRVSDEGNLGVLHFQATPFSRGGFLDVVPKLGVISKRINTALGRPTTPHMPVSQFDAWEAWLGKIDRRYGQFTVEPEEWEHVGRDVRDAVISAALPALDAHISDASLRDRWLTKTDLDVSVWGDATRLGRLLILLEAIGPQDAIPPTRAELKRLAAKGRPLAILWRDRRPGADPERQFVYSGAKLNKPAEWRALAASASAHKVDSK